MDKTKEMKSEKKILFKFNHFRICAEKIWLKKL